jgi:hypothetical protein
VRNDYPTIRMEIAGHPDLEVLELEKILALNFLELLSVAQFFTFICESLYHS